jgi:ParE toxin of type II toxin-antitoxin system, parDE
MKIKFQSDFYFLLNEIVDFIAKDKLFASRKFKKDLLIALKKDLQNPYSFKKSIYFDDLSTRDYVFKSYTITYKIETENKLVVVLGIIKNKNTL